MFSRPATTFRARARLAISLSWIAGFVNAVTLAACGQTVSHQTGNTTRLGLSAGEMMHGDRAGWMDFRFAGLLIGCFLFGAVLSGLITEWTRRRHGRARFVVPMIVEGLLLSVSMICLTFGSQAQSMTRPFIAVALSLASLAMGLQNATITRISGAVVRTTHLTGVITDFGLELVQLAVWWRDQMGQSRPQRFTRMLRVTRRQSSAQRIALLGSIFGSFLIGVTLGALLFPQLGPAALLAPIASLTALIVLSKAAV